MSSQEQNNNNDQSNLDLDSQEIQLDKKNDQNLNQKPNLKDLSQEKNDELNDEMLIDRVIDETKYLAKKPIQKESQYKLDADDLEKQLLESLKATEKHLQKLKKEEQQELIYMKKKYPLRFCITHKLLFETAELYKKHVISNDPVIAKIEGFVNFQCENCYEIFVKYGWYKRHIQKCTGQDQVLDKLTPRQRKLLKISEQLENYK